METSQIPEQRGGPRPLARPAWRARDDRGHRLLIGLVIVSLVGLALLVFAFFSVQRRSDEQGDAIRSLASSATALSDQVRSLGEAPVVSPQQIAAPAAVASTPGAPGAPGSAGAPGVQGLPGGDGAPGAPGAVGPAGPPGPEGQPGADGAAGADGAPGQPGADGAPGPQGRSVVSSGPVRDDGGVCVFRTTYSDGPSSDAPTRDENCPAAAPAAAPAPAAMRMFFPT